MFIQSKTYEGSCPNSNIECDTTDVSTSTCVNNFCRCPAGQIRDGSNNNCLAETNLQVTVTTGAITTTTTSATIPWTAEAYGYSVSYTATTNPAGSQSFFTGTPTGVPISGLAPGTSYTVTITSAITGNSAYTSTASTSVTVYTKQTYEGSCPNSNIECDTTEISTSTCVNNYCRCPAGQIRDGSNNNCLSDTNLQVTVTTGAITTTTTSATIPWTAETYGYSVSYTATTNPAGTQSSFTGTSTGVDISGLAPGTSYDVTITSAITGNNAYTTTTASTTVNVYTKQTYEGSCPNSNIECDTTDVSTSTCVNNFCRCPAGQIRDGSNNNCLAETNLQVTVTTGAITTTTTSATIPWTAEAYGYSVSYTATTNPAGSQSFFTGTPTGVPISGLAPGTSYTVTITSAITGNSAYTSTASTSVTVYTKQTYEGSCPNSNIECDTTEVSTSTCVNNYCRCPADQIRDGSNNNCLPDTNLQVTVTTGAITTTTTSATIPWTAETYGYTVSYTATTNPAGTQSFFTGTSTGVTISGLAPGTSYDVTITSTITGNNAYTTTTASTTVDVYTKKDHGMECSSDDECGSEFLCLPDGSSPSTSRCLCDNDQFWATDSCQPLMIFDVITVETSKNSVTLKWLSEQYGYDIVFTPVLEGYIFTPSPDGDSSTASDLLPRSSYIIDIMITIESGYYKGRSINTTRIAETKKVNGEECAADSECAQDFSCLQSGNSSITRCLCNDTQFWDGERCESVTTLDGITSSTSADSITLTWDLIQYGYDIEFIPSFFTPDSVIGGSSGTVGGLDVGSSYTIHIVVVITSGYYTGRSTIKTLTVYTKQVHGGICDDNIECDISQISSLSCLNNICRCPQNEILSNDSNQCIPAGDAESDSFAVAAIVGIVVAVVLIVVAIVAGVIYYHRRKKIPKDILTVVYKPESTNLRERPIPIRQFEEWVIRYHKDANMFFQGDFEDGKKLSEDIKHETSEAEKEENKFKNRYTNVLPYDHSRVKLATQAGEDDKKDFINANYIPGINSPREYIATQHPMHNTIPDFWRMVWQQNSRIVVMISDVMDIGKTECKENVYWPETLNEYSSSGTSSVLYWPETLNKPVNYGGVVVKITKFSQINKFSIREIEINMGQSKRRKVTHFLLPGWLDYSANLSHNQVIEFIKLVRQEATQSRSAEPIVVHCNSGCGRTGTFLSLDYFIQYINKNGLDGEIDIFSYVNRMRYNRCSMVQSESQYVFIYDAMREVINQRLRDEQEKLAQSDVYVDVDSVTGNGNIYVNTNSQSKPDGFHDYETLIC